MLLIIYQKNITHSNTWCLFINFCKYTSHNYGVFPLILIIYYYGTIKVMLGTSLCNIIKFYIEIL